MKQQEKTPDIAIIGLSCRFPQAPTPEAFWQIVANGRTVFQATPESRKLHHAPELLAGVRAGFLESPYDFDNARFGIPDAEAIFMDPQQRIMLELAIEAMENAGYPAWSNQPVGVFVGADQLAYQEMISSRWYRRKTADYLLESEAFQQIPPDNRQALQAELEALRALEPLPPHALVGNLANMIPGRIAHELNLKGPAFSVDTACSSSLVAVHLACESLKQGECDTALAGGVNLNLSPSVFQYMSAAGVISPSAKCIPFSRDSDGILLGEGAAMVALKRLDDALRDGDAVWAVIRGASINNDGRSLGLMAPAWKGQLALLQSAYARAGFDPAKITALEAHGTSTRIGDGVELSVIEKFFPLNPENPVSVGSVKSNFGHTLAAAGIAGLLKMTLALHHKKLPPTLHETIDPNKNLAEKGIRIQSELADWVCEGPRCAGVSSFGFGGTNAHLILEEPATAPVFHPAPASLGARKFFQYDFFPQLTPESQTVTTLCWTENPLPLPPPSYEPAHWLVFGFETGQLEQIRAQLSQQGKSSYGVLCQAGSGPSAFTRTGEQDFCIDAGKPDHYRWLLGSLPGAEPLGLLFLADGSPAAEPEQFIEKNLSGLRSLFQAAKQRGQAKIWVATAGAYPVQAAEPVRPEQRALAVLAAGALEENPELRGALIDRSVSEAADLGALLPLLGVAAPGPLALRAGRQFLPALKPVKKNAPDGIALSIKPGGLYLVVGGSSGIGALLAEYFIRQSARKVLVSGARDADSLPPNLTAWMPDRLAYFQSDVSKKAAMAELIDTVYEQYGAPDGIVFAAGSINFGALLNKSQADFERVLLAKIAGASYLSDSLQGRRPGFVYTLSSIAGLSPQWAGGLADYAAANAFLDALAETNYQAAAPWISCSWGIWEHTGMAARLGETARGFAPEDALEIFDDTLAAGRAHVAALPTGQEAQFSPDFSEKKAERLPEKPAPASVPPPVTPAESAAPPAGPSGLDLVQMLKKYIAEAVQTAPGDIDENHSFYQLGLDSLSAVDVAQKIEAHTRQVLHPTILFEHDTIAALAKYLETNRLDAPQPEPPPVETNAADPKRFALIGAQKTFYAQQQFFPEKPCNVLVNAELERPLNPEKLQAALNGLAAQHEALRLAFEMTNEGPRQYVLEKIEAPLECMACADDAALLALENELVNRVFDLEKPPFFRLAYVELPEGRAALLLMMHHLIFDAWSMYVLLKALLRSYEQLDSGETPPAGEPDQDFAAYVQFHQQALQHRELEGIKKYWTQALDQAVWSLPLPYRPTRGAVSAYRMEMGELGRAATERLMQANQNERLSVFHSLLAAFFLALQRQTGRTDMIIRVANANRDAAFPGIETLAGCLADALPLRLELQAGDALPDVARRIKQKMLEALRHAGLSSQDIAELPIGRQDEGPVVLSPVGLSFVPTHHLGKDGAMPIRNIRCRTALPFTDISLICFIENNNLKCCWNYDAALFEAQDIAQLRDHFLGILNPPHEPAELLAPPLEMPAVQLFPDSPMLHQKVWAACDRFATRTAVVAAEGSLSYDELARRSKLLAGMLAGRLAKTEETVGIFAYPGIAAVLGTTGILGSGRAFVPLDPDWPDDRVAGILAHAGVKTIVAPADLLALLAANTAVQGQIQSVVVPEERETPFSPAGQIPVVGLEKTPAGSPNGWLAADPRRLAYVMYTSGTSGAPKGVMVAHAAVEVFLNWIAETFRIDAGDRFIHTSSLGFGGSIRQIFSTLLAGATLYPIPRAELKDPQALYEFLERHRITLLNTVPSVVNNLLDWAAAQPGNFQGKQGLASLRCALLGGETLQAETVRRWQQLFGRHTAIVNLYGSTETIVNATSYPIDPAQPPGPGSVPIGVQKKGSLVRLVHPEGRLCAPGETGQIYVGGPCLAAGYFREKALTEEKFVRLDLPEAPGIFYATGDLAWADETGLLYFTGRNDDQIQLHGNRIELTEIEDAIYQTQQVKNTAVVDCRTGGQHLLGAFVELAQTGIRPTAQQIRDFIAQKLPAYMLPHRVILLDQMPLNQAGKTDRAALRRLLAETVENSAPEAPETALRPAEAAIATVWKTLLQVNSVGPEDDFFRLGGDSIMALEMLHRLRKNFPVLPKAVTLFKNRKLAELARSIEELNPQASAVVAAGPEKVFAAAGRHPLSPSQKGFVLLKKIFPGASPNWAGLLLFEGNFQPERLAAALDFLVVRHSMLRTVFTAEGLQTWQQIAEVQKAPVQVFDLSGQSPEAQQEVLDAAFLDLQRVEFDLAQYPLFQARVYRTGSRTGALLLCMHHIITDGWSTHILLNDLMRAYDQLLDGQSPDLGPPPPLYAGCLPLLDSKISPDALDAHAAYWNKILAELPAFAPPPGADALASPALSFILPAETREKLAGWSKTNGITLYNLLLTLFARSLAQLYGTEDLLLNTAVNGRDIPVENVQQIVGCFARNLPLRAALPRDSALLADVKTMEAVFYQALEHQDIPPTELFKIATRAGFASAIFSANRFYFSFMDFSALEKYAGRHLSLLWEASTFSFNAGGAGSEIMMGVNVAEQIRLNLNGYATAERKAALKTIFLTEINLLSGAPDLIDAALIAYLPGPDWLLSVLPGGLPAGEAAAAWAGRLLSSGRADLLERVQTPLGVSGAVFLPFDAETLRAMTMERRVAEIGKAIDVARRHGAKTVALAGILPAITNYGYAVNQAMQATGANGLPPVTLTTGHASTVVAVVKTAAQALAAVHSDIENKTVAVLGFGSIGQASTTLLLDQLGSPARLIIADLQEQLPQLERALDRLKKKYAGELTVLGVGNEQLPDVFYEADLIIGASASGRVLEVARFRPGTILVDDSFPPAIDIRAGIDRMEQAVDVLLLGGGKLQPGGEQTSFFPDHIPEKIARQLQRYLGAEGMPGCRVEPLLLQHAPELPATIGLVEERNALLYWEKCSNLGVEAAPLHLAGYAVPDSLTDRVAALIKHRKQRLRYEN